eukprot:1406047-Pyramimonas_sp.AAC.1
METPGILASFKRVHFSRRGPSRSLCGRPGTKNARTKPKHVRGMSVRAMATDSIWVPQAWSLDAV